MIQKTKRIILYFIDNESGQSAVEYVLIATALLFLGYFAVDIIREALASKFNKLSKFRAGTIGIAP